MPPTVYETGGCEECASTGYRGRQGIFELLLVDEDIRKLILDHTPAEVIKNKAIANQHMRTLRDDGWRTVANGETTVAEVLRVTQE
jgi:type II secretory ATPase GspE/PulE/Tfp pilus assembly ATPase PilB-like protein